MKRLLFLVFLAFLANTAFSQLEVKPNSFKETIGFVNTNPDSDYQTDDNDLPFAVIKVRTENISDKQRRELVFEGNGGTFIMLEYKVGEVWVYLTAKYADYLKISHPEFSSIEFTLPYDLVPKHGYEMTLVNKTAPVHEGWGSLSLTTTPSEATVIINGNVINKTTPYSNDMMPDGKYEITVSKERYKTITKVVDIKAGENTKVVIDLPIDVAIITLKTTDDVDVYIDGAFKKKGMWTGELKSGNYEIVYKKQYYHDARRTIIVEGGVPKTYELQPEPIWGEIEITTNPSGAIVLIDNIDCGVTPLTLNNIIIGTHELKIKMDEYDLLKKQFILEEGKTLRFDEKLERLPDVVVKGVFSVSPTKKVMFARGNLQYQASTKTWRFAEHQWDIIGSENSNISENYDGWIDLFGWGTGKAPTKNSSNNNDYSSFYDWGENAISNNGGKTWRTLTKDEWTYVLQTRNTTTGIKIAKATVNGEKGLILLPDNWNKSNYKLSKTDKLDVDFNSNIISRENWINKLEVNGAVFLPAAGWRYGNDVYYIGSFGLYLSATSNNNEGSYNTTFNDSNVKTDELKSRHLGRSVRLVCPAE